MTPGAIPPDARELAALDAWAARWNVPAIDMAERICARLEASGVSRPRDRLAVVWAVRAVLREVDPPQNPA